MLSMLSLRISPLENLLCDLGKKGRRAIAVATPLQV